MPTVYFETTIIGHLTARLVKDLIVAGQMIATREWWEGPRKSFDVYASQAVVDEASAGDPVAAAERLEVLATIPNLAITDEAKGLARALVSRAALPVKAGTDALHVAIAATNGIDYLLTWNCRHLANAQLRARIEQVCREHGVEAPEICTPFQLTEVEP